MTSIHLACRSCDLEALRRELDDGVSPNALDGSCTPLHTLSNGGDDVKRRVACLNELLEAGADIHATTAFRLVSGWSKSGRSTPLHLAAAYSNENVVAALLKAGADVSRRDADNNTPLHLACRSAGYRSVEKALLIIRNGADPNVRDGSGLMPLEWMVQGYGTPHTQRRLLPILLRAGAALPAQTTNAYIRKVIAAGGIENYERAHLATLTATFTSKLRLPARPARRVVEYAFHAGDYSERKHHIIR